MSTPKRSVEVPEDEVYKSEDMHWRHTGNAAVGAIYGHMSCRMVFLRRFEIIVEAYR
jgi:hypothetical protein